jgi:hypothetical protein
MTMQYKPAKEAAFALRLNLPNFIATCKMRHA